MENQIDKLVFVVEDDVLQLTMTEKKLRQLNFKNIKTFLTARECLEAIDQKPEILILDYYLEESKTALDVMKTYILKLLEFAKTNSRSSAYTDEIKPNYLQF